MTSLFHFEDKVHHRNLTRAESIPLLFSRLLRQIQEHIGFPVEPRLERRRDCDTVLTVDRWKIMPCSYNLPPPDPAKDQSEVDLPIEKHPALAVHIEEPQLAASSVPTPAITAPFPTASASYVPPKPSTPSTTAPKDVSGPSTTSPPPQHISISTQDFLVIMGEVRTFSVTSASFVAAHTALVERMTRTEAALT